MATIQRALISVSDKTNIVSFAQALAERQIPILSTGGTAKLLQKHGIAVTEVADYTGFAEMMDGRIKTLHPKIHGGLLGRRGQDDEVMAAQGIEPIDLLIVNLYPFAQTIADPHCDLATAIENIDIGGPAMLRAAAKNYTAVTVVVDPSDYATLLTEMQAGQISEMTRQVLARKVFAHTAYYDGLIANYLGSLEEDAEKFPPTLSLQYQKIQTMRYGENPHQNAAFYTDPQPPSGTIASATQIQGKALSYNNIADADTALECVKSFDSQPTCVIVKHANPCGVATADHLLNAYQKAYQTDPTSAFGGIIAFNRTLDVRTAETIVNQQFVEVIIAPDIEENAKPLLAKKTNVRVLTTGQWRDHPSTPIWDLKRVTGGVLVQDADTQLIKTEDLKVVSQRHPTDSELQDLLFAWKVVKFVKSNAIVYAKAGMTIGIGAGQMSRVYSAKIAALKAMDEKLVVAGSVMASDAFFPFRDSVDTAAEAGIKAIIQPGGSKRDEEVIAAANEHHISMVFTGMRHFRH